MNGDVRLTMQAHIAGPARDGWQRCTRCGSVITEPGLTPFAPGPVTEQIIDGEHFGWVVGYHDDANRCPTNND